MKRFYGTIVVCVLIAAIGRTPGCRSPLCPAGEEPYVIIDSPPYNPGGNPPFYSCAAEFEWHAPAGQPTHSTRHLVAMLIDTNGIYDPEFDIIADLASNPRRYERMWTPWITYSESRGKGTTAGVGEWGLEAHKIYCFAVQTKDLCGRTTEHFVDGRDACIFQASDTPRPLLTIREPSIGAMKFRHSIIIPACIEYPFDHPLRFSWSADALPYGGKIVGYRYGWDIVNPDDPGEWDVPPHPAILEGPVVSFAAGVHTLWVEAIDNGGYSTIGKVEITIIPFTMDRNLLWVDDFFSVDEPIYDKSHPPEYEHDAFWMEICGRAADWTASDIYDCVENNNAPPDLELIGRYKNIIWTFTAGDQTGWKQVVLFTPESKVGVHAQPTLNYLAVFLEMGGHLWTLGRSERTGGLAAVLQPENQLFPVSLECRVPEGPCDVDPDYVRSMAYEDYCVTMIDKIVGIFRYDEDMPMRRRDFYDVMIYAYRETADPVAVDYLDLPERLELSDEVTAQGMYFDPTHPPGGFTYVEIYDPEYRMSSKSLSSQECFHPLYRMRSRSTRSAVDNTAVALCLTRYEDIVPRVTGGIAAPARSFHFGFPLWFFDRTHVEEIADVIFEEWRILR